MSIRLPDFSALIQNHHLAKQSANIALYEPKKQVYFQLKKHLEQPFSGRTAYERFLDIIPKEHALSRDEVEKLKFEINHLFSESENSGLNLGNAGRIIQYGAYRTGCSYAPSFIVKCQACMR